MNYMPQVGSMNHIASAPLTERYTVAMFDQIQSTGRIEYAFLVVVVETTTQEPVYCVASEVNTMAATLGDGSHFLGVFDGKGHVNHGASDEWGDPKKFFAEALRLTGKVFGTE